MGVYPPFLPKNQKSMMMYFGNRAFSGCRQILTHQLRGPLGVFFLWKFKKVRSKFLLQFFPRIPKWSITFPQLKQWLRYDHFVILLHYLFFANAHQPILTRLGKTAIIPPKSFSKSVLRAQLLILLPNGTIQTKKMEI